MMQMAREMNQRSLQTQVPQQQQQQLPGGQDPNQAVGQQWGQQGVAKEMKMGREVDSSYASARMEVLDLKREGAVRLQGVVGKFSGLLSLINDSYGPELWETIHADYPYQPL